VCMYRKTHTVIIQQQQKMNGDKIKQKCNVTIDMQWLKPKQHLKEDKYGIKHTKQQETQAESRKTTRTPLVWQVMVRTVYEIFGTK